MKASPIKVTFYRQWNQWESGGYETVHYESLEQFLSSNCDSVEYAHARVVWNGTAHYFTVNVGLVQDYLADNMDTAFVIARHTLLPHLYIMEGEASVAMEALCNCYKMSEDMIFDIYV